MLPRQRIIVEGWRHSPTSYAVLNQFQLLEMLKRPELEVYHRDLPYWLERLKPVHGLFSPDDEARINAIPEPPPGLMADALLRIAHPTDVTPSTQARRTFVWIATDYGILEESRTTHGLTARQALNHPGVRYLTCSKWSYDGLLRSGAEPSTLSIVPCGIDPALFHAIPDTARTALRKAMGWEGKFVFLHISTLLWSKGMAKMFTAFASLLDRFPDAILVVKGSNEWLQSDHRLQMILGEMGPALADKVKARLAYCGTHLTHERMAVLYNAADCYLAPYHAEGFCIPVLEAGACGLPVICTGGGSTDDFTDPCYALRIPAHELEHPEVVRTHGPGSRILEYSLPDLIDLMVRVMSDPAIGARARAEAPAWVQARFTWKHVVDRLLAAMLPETHGSAAP